MSKQPLRIIPLGGLGEIGKNMTAIEYDGKIVVVDCGLAFPRDEMLGIDLVLPDVTFLKERQDDLLAFLITHGHEDHFGALPFVLRQVNAPVYASRLTLAFAKSKLDEHGLLKKVELNEVTADTVLRLGPFTISFVGVRHSVPDALSVVVETPLGVVLVTGDYKFDLAPIDGRLTDVDRFAELGDRGVLALLGDSTNARKPGATPSESTVGESFHKIFAEAEGRVLLACFASSIHRVQQAIKIAHMHGRKFAVAGRSMVKNVNIARNLGYLTVPEDAMIKLQDIDQYEPHELLIITTGSQGEPLSALSRMAFNDHPQVALNPGDTVIISAWPIPGNEISVANTIACLLKSGARVIDGPGEGVHVSGHGAQEDLLMMLKLTKPRYFLPVHGEYRMQYVHAELARQSGLKDEQIFILENGDVLQIDEQSAAVVGKVHAGMVFVDGFELGDSEHVVLHDRQQLSEDGILIAVCTVSVQTGMLIAPPELVARGFLYDDDRLQEVLATAREALEEKLDELADEHITGQRLLKEDVHEVLGTFIYRKTKRRPLIMPVIIEI